MQRYPCLLNTLCYQGRGGLKPKGPKSHTHTCGQVFQPPAHVQVMWDASDPAHTLVKNKPDCAGFCPQTEDRPDLKRPHIPGICLNYYFHLVSVERDVSFKCSGPVLQRNFPLLTELKKTTLNLDLLFAVQGF